MKKNKNKNKNTYLFIALLIFCFCFSLFLLLFFKFDPDYFWHIKAGEHMFKGGILRHDIFSWYVKNKYWVSHEWLFEIIIYGFKLLFGEYHVLIYCFITLVSLLFIMFISRKNDYMKNIPFTLVWYLMFFLMIIGYVQARPHMISFSLLALTIYFLYDLYKNENSKKVYFLPLITIFWANVHGGSSNLTYIFCAIFIVCGLFSFSKGKIQAKKFSKKQLIKYIVVMFLCMICVCINVHGFKMFIYPYQNMLDSTMLENISEWRSTSLGDAYHYVYFVSLLVIVFVVLFSRKKIDFIDLILFGVSVFLGLKSVRFWIYLYIVMNFVIFNYVEERKLDKGTVFSIIIISLIFVGAFLINIKQLQYNCYLDKKVIDILKVERPKRLFNMYDYGGELIYNDIAVFVDGRADLYSRYNFKDYLKLSNLKDDYVDLISKYNFDYFLVDKKYPISDYLGKDGGYEKIYSDKKIELYKCS